MTVYFGIISFLYYSMFADLFLNAFLIYSLSKSLCLFLSLSFILSFISFRARCDFKPRSFTLFFIGGLGLWDFTLSAVDPPLPLPYEFGFFFLTAKSLSLTESVSKTFEFEHAKLLNFNSFELSQLWFPSSLFFNLFFKTFYFFFASLFDCFIEIVLRIKYTIYAFSKTYVHHSLPILYFKMSIKKLSESLLITA